MNTLPFIHLQCIYSSNDNINDDYDIFTKSPQQIYDLACESTFFGLEEFVAVHEMCDVLIRSR